ncbi:MAG: helix-turn-helix domain-containing protein [Actinomycetota bacterium]|nr:helix-turn-helix domain-containing protein [Actinomycetota bacterium]
MTPDQQIDYQAIATAVRERRRQKGWTQRQLAGKAKLGLSTVQKIESGKHEGPFQPNTLPALSKALDWRWDALDRIGDGLPPSAPPQSFGENLRAQRVRLALTVDELAEAAGLSADRLAQLERGEAEPRLREEDAIERALQGEARGTSGRSSAADPASRVVKAAAALDELGREFGLRVEVHREDNAEQT